MGMVAVATVSDDGAAQALVELLTEHEIPVDVRSFGTDSYLGTATPQTYEVRVPEDQLDEARSLIRSIDSTPGPSDTKPTDEATTPLDEEPQIAESQDPSDELPAERSPRLWMVVPLGIVGIVPVGCLYARWPRLGYLLLSIGAGGLLAGLMTGQPRGLVLFALAKALDLVLAPTLLAITSQRRNQSERPLRNGLLLSVLCLLAVIGVGLSWQSAQRRSELTKQSSVLFEQAFKQILDGQPPIDEAGQALKFPPVPVGQVHAALVEYCVTWPQRLRRIIETYVDQRRQWESLDGAPPSESWSRLRLQDAQQLCALVTEYQSAWESMVERLQPAFREDHVALELFIGFETAFKGSKGQQRVNHLVELMDQQCKLWQAQAQQLADNKPDEGLEKRAELAAQLGEALNGF